MNFSTCYIDKSADKPIINDNDGNLWKLQGYLSITTYDEESADYEVSFKPVVDYEITLKAYPSGETPRVFAHEGDVVPISRFIELWSMNAKPYVQEPSDYLSEIKSYGFKIENDLKSKDIDLTIAYTYGRYRICIGDVFFPFFDYDEGSRNFCFIKSIKEGKKDYLYGVSITHYLADMVFALREILATPDIKIKDIYFEEHGKPSRELVASEETNFPNKQFAELAGIINRSADELCKEYGLFEN